MEYIRKDIKIRHTDVNMAGDPSCHYFKNLPADFDEHERFFTAIKGLNPGPRTIIDVGANIGLFALGAAFEFPDAQIVAYEPHPSAFGALQENLHQYSPRLTARNLALAATTKEVSFYPGGPVNFQRSAGSHLVNDTHWKDQDERIKIRAATLDEEVAALNLDGIDVVKIDVEGFELDVIEGMAKTISSFNPLIIFEFNAWALMALKNINPRTALEIVRSKFSNVSRIQKDGGLQPISDDDEAMRFLHDNLIFHGCVDDLLLWN